MPSEFLHGAGVEHARAARANAYAPYSRFEVGAAVLTADGRIFSGANVENGSYGLSLCAERVAAAAAVAGGAREFAAIAIAGPQEATTAPCGACRQFLSEFNPSMGVAYTSADRVIVTTLDRLLPESFRLP